MSSFARAFAEQVADATGQGVEAVLALVGSPPREELGQLAFPCFELAKQQRSPPPKVAGELAARIAPRVADLPALREVRAVGPYVNAFLDGTEVARRVLPEVLGQGRRYGCLDLGHGGVVTVDFSSPNIAKTFGIHHLRSTVVGHALVGMLAAAGYRPVGINHLGDWGTQFGQLLTIWDERGDEQQLAAEGVLYLHKLYKEFNDRKKAEPGLQERARQRFKDLEDGDPATRALWQRFRDVSLAEFERVYALLGVRFDDVRGESFYEDKMGAVLDELEAKGLLTVSDDATVVDLSRFDLPPALVRKADGSTLYLTRDLAAAEHRQRTHGFVRSLYVVGEAQALHFAQLKRVLELLGRPWASLVEHVPFGMMRFTDRKMSSREMDIIPLEEVLRRAVALARETIVAGAQEKDQPVPDDVDELAHRIGVGAVVFNDLKNRRVRDVVFDWKEVLSFDGETGPYLQYTAARIASMAERWGRQPDADVRCERLDGPGELALLLSIADLPDSLAAGVAASEPSLVADRLLDVAQRFSTLYSDREWKVLSDDEELTAARMALAAATRVALCNGLSWLGIPVPDRM